MPGWNIADVFEVVAATVPASPALIQGGRVLSWRELDDRAGQVAAYLGARGLVRQDKVVQYLRNCPEYLESFAAALKGSLVPVNTNYRYGPEELSYLWRDCDARAVVFAGSFTATIERTRASVPEVLAWLWVDDGSGPCPPWAAAYESAAAPASSRPEPRWERDGDDIILLYTGGTTGLPKGVIWRQDDLMVSLGNAAGGRYPGQPDLAFARSRIADPGRRHLPAAPLMHGAGCLTCLPVLARGGAAVLLAGPAFRAGELLDTIQRHRVNSVGWVGDAFARPVLAELDAHPGRWDLSSWSVLTSGGVLFSDEVKQGLLRHVPGLLIADVYGSSEAIAAARSVSRSGVAGPPARSFTGGGLTVLADDDSPVAPGSGQIGRVAYAGRLPVGYYKDEAKSAATFRTVRGRRYVITGDFATVQADGQVIVLGRGSSCINTGGEKVYPEEVEEVLKRHPSVADAAVLGLPDERFGETVAAAVQLAGGCDLDDEALRAHVRGHLAGYKVPRQVVAVPEVTRGPNGKIDIPRMRALLEQSRPSLTPGLGT
jgi:acyl-CoA synthetase (AMP-forming)/AMP-acid ligase II